jgi:tetratricopeptide (TPR) repeat protein
LKSRTDILLNFTKALVYLAENNLEAAEISIQKSIYATEDTSQNFAGREIIYLLAAQIYIKKENYDLANKMLDSALALNDEYARAYLARGTIFYSQATKANNDAQLFEQALEQFEIAYSLPNQPEGAYIPIKAHTALGNAYVVRAQQTNDPVLYSLAIENYNVIIKEYERTKDPFVKEFAAIAYFGLGAAYERQGDKESAVSAYQNSYELTDDPKFKERIELQIQIAQGQQ